MQKIPLHIKKKLNLFTFIETVSTNVFKQARTLLYDTFPVPSNVASHTLFIYPIRFLCATRFVISYHESVICIKDRQPSSPKESSSYIDLYAFHFLEHLLTNISTVEQQDIYTFHCWGSTGKGFISLLITFMWEKNNQQKLRLETLSYIYMFTLYFSVS